MTRHLLSIALVVMVGTGMLTPAARAQVQNYKPVTQEMLTNPSPNDWLMFSRTYDAQRYSPLNQINRQNVSQLGLAWTRGLANGTMESIPLVHDGVMYVIAPPASVLALDATNGEVIWEYKHRPDDARGASGRSKAISIYGDVILYMAPDNFIVGIDARTGVAKWKVPDTRGHSSGSIAVDGKFISGGACSGGLQSSCYIAAHDAETGKELWKFYTAQGATDVNPDTWGGAPADKRTASTWGLPGTYDPVRKVVYWGIANPTPNTRLDRHAGNIDAIPRIAPSDLYSNSTVALDPETGKLKWYYQHLPGDDWDEDYTHERTLIRTAVSPDPKFVKWANPDIPKGQQRDIAVMVGEGGGVFAMDRNDGKFLWATPFPYDTPNFLIKNIDVKTGKTEINWDLVFKDKGEKNHTICFYNTRSYWPTAYSPKTNSLYVPYNDNCLDMGVSRGRTPVSGPKSGMTNGPNKMAGVAKINMSTGEIQPFYLGHALTNGSVVVTAGDVVFWGDLNRRFMALDSESGKVLWDTILGGSVSVSTITYAVNGKQYVAVMTGDGALTGTLTAMTPDLKVIKGYNAIFVFALADKR
jgi:PQQ-dependent dehydrogenase (methanol/ethanol family)